MNKTTNQYINQLNLDPKKEAAVRKLVENAGGVNDSTPLVENLVGNELIPIKQDGENKAVRADELVKGGKEVFILTPDMFEEASTIVNDPYPTLTFTDDGLNKFTEAVEANKIIGINKAVFNFIENSARPFTIGVEPGNYVFSTYVGVLGPNTYILSFEILNPVTTDIDRYEITINSNTFMCIKNMSADGSFYLDASMFVEPTSGISPTGVELNEVYQPALTRAIDSHKIIKIDYNVLGYLDMIATPYAGYSLEGYFILDNILKTSNTAFQATVLTPETNYQLTIYYNDGIFTADKVDMSDIYILNPDDYSTAEDFRLLEGAIDNSRIIQLIIENTAFIGTVASKSDSSIFISVGITYPDYYVMDNPAIQYGAYNFKSDGTVNKLEPKMLTFETTKDGTKFLADDGSYKEVGPYIWNEETSETIFNELKEAIESGRRIIHYNYRECFEWEISDTKIELRFIDNKQNREGNYIIYIITSTSITTKYIDTGYRLDEYSTTLSPNIYYKLANVGTNTNYTFKTLNKYYNDEINEYQGEFSFGDTLYTITFPDTVKWSTDSVLEYKANHTYQFKIVNNLGVMKEFANS